MALTNASDVSPPLLDTSHNTPASQAWSHISSTVWAAPSNQKFGYGQTAPWLPPSENPNSTTQVAGGPTENPIGTAVVLVNNPILWNLPAPWRPSQAVLPNPEANSIANPAPAIQGSDTTTSLPPDVTVPETMQALESAASGIIQIAFGSMCKGPLPRTIFKVGGGISLASSLMHAGLAYHSAKMHHDTWSDLLSLERQDLAHRADWLKTEFNQLKAKF
jgi:hypothetical protein